MVSLAAATFYVLQIFLKRAAKPSAGTFSGTLLNLIWLHQSPPDLLQNLLQNPTWLCTKASRNLLRNLLRNPVELDRLSTKASQTFSGTFFGTLLNLTWLYLFRNPVEPDLESLRPSPDLLRNPVEPDLALHQSFPDLLGTFSIEAC